MEDLGEGGQNRGRVGAILTANELVLTFVGFYVCANFGENRSRNATVRVLADRQTDTQTQTDFIICPMLYAIAMGQITRNLCTHTAFSTTAAAATVLHCAEHFLFFTC